jgi:hypothetical protein
MIFLDMDGVLADFDTAVHQMLGAPLRSIPDEQMQKEVAAHPGFWDNIPPMHDMLTLWDHFKRYDPFILTAVANWDYDRCHSSKAWWVARYLPDFNQEKLLRVRRSEKMKYARDGLGGPNILIDDYVKNIKEWTQAGGWGILHVSAKQTIETFPNVEKALRNTRGIEIAA